MERFADFILRKRNRLFGGLLVFTVISLFLATLVEVNLDLTQYLPEDSNLRAGLELMDEEFGHVELEGLLYVMFENTTEDQRTTIYNQLTQMTHVEQVVFEADSDRHVQEGYALYRMFLQAGMTDEEERAFVQTLFDDFDDFTFHLYGDIEGSTILLDMMLIIVPTVIILILIFFIMCRSWFEPIIFFINIGIAILINTGTNELFPHISSASDMIAGVLQIALSMDYAIIFLNRYRREKEMLLETGINDIHLAMKNAIMNSFSTVSGIAFTTILGMLMLVFMSFTIGADIGLVIAKSVFISLICVFGIMPALILRFDKLIEKTSKPVLNLKMSAVGNIGFKAKYFVTVLFFALFGVAFVVQNNLVVTYSELEFDRIHRTFEMDNIFAILYENTDAEYLENILLHLNEHEAVEEVFSYVDLLETFTDLELAAALEMDELVISLVYRNYFLEELPTLSMAEYLEFLEGLSEVPMLAEMLPLEELEELFLLQAMLEASIPPEIDPYTGWIIDPTTGEPIPPQFDQITGWPLDHVTGLPRDPATGLLLDSDAGVLFDPTSGIMIDPVTGWIIDPDTLEAIPPQFDQITGWPLDHVTGLPRDPATGLLLDPDTGALFDATTGLILDQATGLMFDAATESFIDPTTMFLIDPTTMQPILDPTTWQPIEWTPVLPPGMEDYEALIGVLMNPELMAIPIDAEEIAQLMAMDVAMVEQSLYLYDVIHGRSTGQQMSVPQFIDYLLTTLVPMPIFQPMFTDEVLEFIEEASGDIEQITALLVAENFSRIQINTTLPIETEETFAFIDELYELLDQELFGEFFIVGESIMPYELSQSFPSESSLITLLTTVAFFIVVTISLKSMSVAVLLTIVIQASVFIAMAATIFLDINLSFLDVVIVQAILKSRVIDYGIFYISNYIEARRGNKPKQAVITALNHSIDTILTSGLIMVLVTFVCGVVFLRVDRAAAQILFLISQGCFVGIILSVFVLPSLIAVFDRLVIKKEKGGANVANV